MNTPAELHIVLNLAKFGGNARNLTVEFCGENITELSSLPRINFNKVVGFAHKPLVSLTGNPRNFFISSICCSSDR